MVNKFNQDMQPIRDLIRETEEANPKLEQKNVAQLVYDQMDNYCINLLAFDWINDNVRRIRREKQLKTEREAQRARNEKERQESECKRREQAEQEQKKREEYNEERMRQARERDKRAQKRGERERQRLREKFQPWITDPGTIPLDFLTGGPVAKEKNPDPRFELHGPRRKGEPFEFHELLSDLHQDEVAHLPEFSRDRDPGARVILSALQAHNIPKNRWIDLLFDWNLPNIALEVSIQFEIDEAAAQIRLELTAELLGSEFALGDGIRVTWGTATVKQHKQRAEMTTSNAVANAEDAARHLAAVRMIEECDAITLGDLVEQEVMPTG